MSEHHTRPPHLALCPFCGDGGDYSLEPKHLPPRMDGPGAIISYTIRHWCEGKAQGALAATRTVTAREEAPAVEEWNRRAGQDQFGRQL